MGKKRHTILLGVLAGAGAIALALGAAQRSSADTVGPECAGKPLCVTVTGTPDPASRSPVGIDHYVSYSVTVANGGATSNLVNLGVTVQWADVGAATTSDYRAASSDSRCIVTATRTLTCTTPKSLAPGAFETYQLIFRTATEMGAPPLSATATNITATAAAKEQRPKGSGTTAFVTVSNPTGYEPNPELDISTAGGGLSTTLATAAGVGGQSSRLPVPAGAPRGIFELSETGDYTCPTGLRCFGQQVITVATGISPVNVQATYTGEVPPGLSESSFVVFHVRDPGTVPLEVTISAACSGALFSGAPPSGEIPCRRVEITHQSMGIATVEWEVWDTTNGRFNGG
jgi:hypothetical protein